MAENRKGKDSRFYYSRGQMVLLGAAFTFASLIIFALGVFVGKGIETRKVQQKEEPLVRIPVRPGASQSSPAPAAPAKDELTFNESSTKPAAVPGVAEEKSATAATAGKVAKVEAKQESAAKVEAAAKNVEKKAEKSAPAQETAKATEVAESAEQKFWRAQVNAFPDERSAKQIVDRLKNKGYNAYVTEVQNRGKSWFRVSVGKYNSREEADKIVEVLRTKENFPKAFAASR